MVTGLRPDGDLEGVRRSHARLLATVEGLDDTMAGWPSLLPGWDIAMLVTHLARNADSHVHAAEGARVGERRKRYPSPEARDAGIEAGKGLPADQVVEDLRGAIARLERVWDELPAEAWRGASLTGDGEPEPLTAGPMGRWRESEIHHADLGLGFTVDDWDQQFVDRELDRWIARLESRLPDNTGASITATDTGRTWAAGSPRVTMLVDAPSRRLLAWLTGRNTSGFPEIGAWGW
jgi:maleylpyruvate isomerase